MNEGGRVIVIGIDGGTFSIIHEGIRSGKLPTFSRLMENGASGVMESIPPWTGPAWTTIVTGKTLDHHGICSFGTLQRDYEFGILLSLDKKARELWDYAGKSVVINVPFTFPPRKIDGIMISGMMTPTLDSNCTYPEEEKDFLKEVGYVIEPKIALASIENSLRKRIEVMYHYLEKDWNLFFIVFREFDPQQHYFWDTSLKLYELVDEALAGLTQRMAENDTLLIVSDHGFAKVDKVFFIKNFLRRNGYYEEKGAGWEYRMLTLLRKFGVNPYKVSKVIRQYDLERFRAVARLAERIRKPFLAPGITEATNFEKTKAIPGCWMEIYINRKSRFAHGIVGEGECEGLIHDLRNGLESLRDPVTGKKVIDSVLVSREAFSNAEELPDLFFFPNAKEGYTCELSGLSDDIVTDFKERGEAGWHTPEAIFIGYGSQIKKGEQLPDLELIDIVPTVLHILNIPIPRDMDGRVYKEIFEPNSPIAKREIRYQEIPDEKERLKQRIMQLKGEGRLD